MIMNIHFKAIALDLPVGLKNLGNTCYLNSVVQCLKAVPELCDALGKYKNTHGDMTGSLTLALKDTYDFMEKYKQSDFPPILLVQLLRTVFPQFSTMGEDGTPMQQDANECLTELLRVLQQKLPKSTTNAVATANKSANLIDQYFFGEFMITMKCDEAEQEPVTTSYESFLQLSCFISQDVKYLQTGLKLRLEEKLNKNASTLGRDAQFSKTSRITRLPSYLSIQLVRFFYKEKEKVSAKILKDVKFPLVLDLFELCTGDLQKNLIPTREAFKRQEDEETKLKKAEKALLDSQDKAAATSAKAEKNESNYAPFSFENDTGSNNSGYYDLIAVLTHKGRASNSGHYVGWAKNVKTKQWHMYDDDTVTQVTEEDILKLSGGGK
jgi:ubiquitin carboxyl-terminal hydrolase 14